MSTINYLEVRVNNQVLDTLYIGHCNCETEKFTLCNFQNQMYQEPIVVQDTCVPTVLNSHILNKHDIQQIHKSIMNQRICMKKMRYMI